MRRLPRTGKEIETLLHACSKRAPIGVNEHDRRFNLAFRDFPVTPEQQLLLLTRNNTESVALVKTNSPTGVGPGSNEHGLGRQSLQMKQQQLSYSFSLVVCANVSVANESDVPHILNAHHTQQFAILLNAPERDAVVDFMAQFRGGHIGLLAAILGNGAFVSARSVVDNFANRLEVALFTLAKHDCLRGMIFGPTVYGSAFGAKYSRGRSRPVRKPAGAARISGMALTATAAVAISP